MSNEVATTNKDQLPADLANMATALRASVGAVAAGGGKNFLKFTKYGEWIHGAGETEIKPDSEWALNPLTAGVGFVGWGDAEHKTEGKPLGEHFARPMEGHDLIDQSDLPDIPGRWLAAISLDFKDLTDGTEVVWKANSAGARSAYESVMVKIADKLEAGDDNFVPIVKFSKGSYTHAKYGKILTPVIDIVAWSDMDGKRA